MSNIDIGEQGSNEIADVGAAGIDTGEQGGNEVLDTGASVTPGSIPALTLPLVGAFAGGATLLTLTQGDYGSSLTVLLSDANGPLDVSGAGTITLRLRGLYDVADTINASAAVSALVTNGARNGVAYVLEAGDTAQAGDYALEVVCVWTNGQARTSNRLLVTILSDV